MEEIFARRKARLMELRARRKGEDGEPKRLAARPVFDKCPSCGAVVPKTELSHSLYVCTKCGYHHTIGAYLRLAMLLDSKSFRELDQELVAIVPPDHPLAAEDQILLSQLAPYPFITYMPHVQIYRDIMAYISQSGWTPQVFCNATGEASISSLVASGFGVSIVAKTDVLDNSQVKLLHLKDRLYKRTIYMAYRRDEEQPPSMQALLRFVLQRARAQSDSQRHS